MIEYGIFNDEGCIDREFYTYRSAQIALAAYYAAGGRFLSIEELCPEHDEQPKDGCEECDAEEDEDEEDN
jgi:hypothetical protein